MLPSPSLTAQSIGAQLGVDDGGFAQLDGGELD